MRCYALCANASRGFVQAMATKEFWIRTAIILVFSGGGLACFLAYIQAERDGNKRKSIILLATSIVIMIAALVISDYIGLVND